MTDRIRPGSARRNQPESADPAPQDAVESPEVLELDGSDASAPEAEITEDAPDTVDETAAPPEVVIEDEDAPVAAAPVSIDEVAEEELNEAQLLTDSRPPAVAERSAFLRLYHGETRFDFVRRKRLWLAISGIVILAGVISLATRGLNLGIDFVGGTSWTVSSKTLTVNQVQSDLSAVLSGETVTILGNGSQRTVQVEAKLPKGQSTAQASTISTKVVDALAKAADVAPSSVSVDSVGPSWGGQITHKAVEALIVFFVLIALYISIFFEWRMALAAIVAVMHDIIVTVGIYSLSGFEVTPDTVVALLTILGYSLYDTIVVFDRVRDNVKNLSVRDRLTFSDVVNVSMNQTLARSINTSAVAIMPILAVLVLGAEILGASTLQYFGLALLVGLTTGAYSSIFIASPLVAILKEREPRYIQLRERLALRGVDRVLLSASDVARGPGVEVGTRRAGGEDATTSAAERPRGTRPPARPASRRPTARNRPKGGRR